jgi:hypothetical protein
MTWSREVHVDNVRGCPQPRKCVPCKPCQGTVEQIVSAFRAEQPNYKATHAFLRIVELKDFVRHTVRGAFFIFEPLDSKEEAGRRSVQALLRQNFGGSASGLLMLDMFTAP